ncbi:hypothetical protein [Quatrionicoccus australiensis]|uniref:hypothetical protein n=1 Tax=Quatrionicoccus australiensis TaxID=138118 RepID=UPI001CF8F6E7|nr:hypothetical protein [Quatrionicoccus australiensis]UCV16152.1 hypothetical protein KI612_05485 [Quatrionicoccus australiensis]
MLAVFAERSGETVVWQEKRSFFAVDRLATGLPCGDAPELPGHRRRLLYPDSVCFFKFALEGGCSVSAR